MNVFKNLKIRDKLVISFAINILFLLVIGVVSFTSVQKIERNLSDIFEVRLPSVSFLLEADRDLHQALIAERTMLFSDTDSPAMKELVTAFEDNKQQTYDRYQKYSKLITNEQEQRLVPQFKTAYSDWNKAAMEVVSKAQSTSPEERAAAIAASIGDVSQKFDFMRNYIDRATALNMQDAEKAHTQSVKVFKGAIAMIIIVIVVSVGTSVFLAWFIARSITQPLSMAITGLKEVAQGEGDLTKRLEAVGKDEVGELTKWFNAFITNLQGIILKVAENTAATSEAAKHLLKLSQETTHNASSLAERSNKVSEASEEMSHSIQSVSAAVEEYSTNINVVASAAEELNSSVVEISRNTTHANQLTSQSVEEANITSEKMKLLEQAAKEITHVTEVIQSISKQTNLLALNATIEAASAGEAGKGFAVVANEIKELARQTSDATSEIQNQIDSIQSSSGATVTQINRITEMIGDIDSAVSTIAAAVEEQSVTTQEISGNITQASDSIGEVARNVATGSETTATIAQDINEVDTLVGEVNNMSQELHNSANSLISSSSELSNLVNRFKVA